MIFLDSGRVRLLVNSVFLDIFLRLKKAKKLPETKKTPLNICHPKRKGSSSNHHFLGAMLNFQGVNKNHTK